MAATGGSTDAIVVTHTHTATSTSTVTDPGHVHNLSNAANAQISGGGSQPNYTPGYGAASGVVLTASTGITVATSTTNTNTGTSGTNANLPPYYALAYVMKA